MGPPSHHGVGWGVSPHPVGDRDRRQMLKEGALQPPSGDPPPWERDTQVSNGSHRKDTRKPWRLLSRYQELPLSGQRTHALGETPSLSWRRYPIQRGGLGRAYSWLWETCRRWRHPEALSACPGVTHCASVFE